MTTPTKRGTIDAALSVADDVAHGRLDPATLQQQAVTECRELFGTVIGDGDPLWALHSDVARQAVGLGALSPDELREWAAVLDRQRGVEPIEPPAPTVDLLPAESSASGEASQSESTDGDDDGGAPDDAPPAGDLTAALALLTARSVEQRAKEAANPAKAHGGTDGYDPLAGWNAGGSRRP